LTVAVITDSAASLPSDIAAGAGVTIVPLQLAIGGRSHRDGDLSLEELLERVDEGITTSSPTPGDFISALERTDTGDGAVVLTVARTMSATRDAAELAARNSDTDVRVVDTGTAAGAQGLVVLAAARAAQAGAPVDAVEATARAVAQRVRLVATLDSLDRLAKSGRVPEAAAWAGRWLHLNPLFEFRGGRARPLRPARSREAALERIAAECRRAPNGGRLHVAALHALAVDDARTLLELLNAHVEPATALIAPFSPVMVVHTGPNLVGMAWWREDQAD